MDTARGATTSLDSEEVASLPFKVTDSATVTLSVKKAENSSIEVGYKSPDGNRPVAYSNTLFVWAGGPNIPWNEKPVANAAVEQGDTIIPGKYDPEKYVVGYSVGPSGNFGSKVTYPNVCATAAIPADRNLDKVTYTSPNLGITSVQTNAISFTYVFPKGFNPQRSRSWIGLWEGQVNPYGSTSTPHTAPIDMSTSSGDSPMTDLKMIAPKKTYTAALFTSGYTNDPTKLNLTMIASVIVFNTLEKIAAPLSG
ncbi:MAG: hypothetical protein ACRDRQ_13845 [Pseudonocardiaceae bacterium]